MEISNNICVPSEKINEDVNILLVDDRPENLRGLKEILKSTGYKIFTADSGKTALKILLERTYACCLLDIRMPVIDGFETAEMIRSDRDLQNLPIIFVTAEAGDQKDMFTGYEKGAVDFLIKPIEPLIVRSKVKIFGQLYLQKLALNRSKEIEDLNARLLKLNQDLSTANTELEHFTHIAAHDLREPLRKQINMVHLLQNHLESSYSEDTKNLMERISHAGAEMLGMVDDFRRLTKIGMSNAERVEVDLHKLISECVSQFDDQIQSREIEIGFDKLPAKVNIYPSLVKRLYVNLISNALNHVSGNGFEITFTAEKIKGRDVFGVKNSRSSIPQNQLGDIFKIFRRGNTGYKEGSGIGLSICKKIIDRHHGSIYAESQDNSVQIKFTFEQAS